jgi:tetratricopeptide (TPR) repeat protein
MQLFEDDFEDVLEAARSLLTTDEEADLWEANELVNRALSMRPDDPEAWILKAQVLSALDDDVAALAAVEMAVAREASTEALYWKAAFLSDLERFAEALKVVDKALRKLGGDDDWLLEDLYCEKASALEALGRHAEAVATYEKGLARCPDSTLLLAGLDPLRKQSLKASLKVLKGGLEP